MLLERPKFILRSEDLPYILILFLCLLSRLLSSISFYEDPEAMKFSLIALESNFNVLQSSAPVVCFAVKMLDLVLNNIGLNFSLLGGFSTGIVIIYSLKLLRVPLFSLEGGLAAFMIFFNPLLWIMGNSYAPYIAGAALTIAALFYTIEDYYNRGSLNKGFFLIGLLAGTVLQYTLLPLVPGIYYVVKRKQWAPLAYLALGLALWLIPSLIADANSFPNFIQSQLRFFNSGHNFSFLTAIRALWADGMGGYWLGREYFLVLNMLPLLSFLFFGLLVIMGFGEEQRKTYLYGAALLLYLALSLMQSAQYYSALLLPLIPLLTFTAAYGIIYFLINFNLLQVKLIIFIYAVITLYFVVGTALEHSQPTAIAQLQEYLVNKENNAKGLTVLCPDKTMCNYLKKEVKAEFYSPADYKNQKNGASGTLLSIGDSLERKYVNSITFTHNPFINHYSPQITVYEY